LVDLLVKLMPEAPKTILCSYEEASLIKYGANCFFFIKNAYFNILHDIVCSYGADWQNVWEGVISDTHIGSVHTRVGDKGGRGAGGMCLPKDFAVFRTMADKMLPDDSDVTRFLSHAENRNIKLLRRSDKDLEIVNEVYGSRHSGTYENVLAQLGEKSEPDEQLLV
jgi:UDP-glucose 6-dehydrogenase